ncbi:imelysin family protein [Aliiroseovarius sp. 2305UL8-7]|uniref:imelysin family protein n=1 Tax=Aliiroseovarius conchicola TaxID=3121637 RepID=UPI0035273464
MTFKNTLLALPLLLGSTALAQAAEPADVLTTYADIALAGYEDSLTTAKALKVAVDALVASPSEGTLQAAKAAWLRARVPYQQTEAYRFGNPTVDDWEGKVNAWPLDEGMIDYVDVLVADKDAGEGASNYGVNDENPFSTANVIANPALTVGGKSIDASKITPELLESLQEIDGIEANVATGYHVIEFLLWGQDLNGTDHGAGMRPATDYDLTNCTGGNCDRRADYLVTAANLLVSDLEEAVANWSEGGQGRTDVTTDTAKGVKMAFTGMGSLSYGELAGERMKLGLLLNDPEEEHDCFSDNSHNSHYFDALGIRNVYTGRYVRIDGSVVEGPSLYDLVQANDEALANNLLVDLDETMIAMSGIVTAAEGGTSYDQMLGVDAAGGALVQNAIDHLVEQTRNIERAVVVVSGAELAVEGSDSLDNPTAVFQ